MASRWTILLTHDVQACASIRSCSSGCGVAAIYVVSAAAHQHMGRDAATPHRERKGVADRKPVWWLPVGMSCQGKERLEERVQELPCMAQSGCTCVRCLRDGSCDLEDCSLSSGWSDRRPDSDVCNAVESQRLVRMHPLRGFLERGCSASRANQEKRNLFFGWCAGDRSVPPSPSGLSCKSGKVNMRRTSKLYWLNILLLASTLTASGRAEPNAWDGTWKLNVAKSHLSGPTFVIKSLGKNEFQILTSSLTYKLLCDGQYRPVVGNRTVACLKATEKAMDTAEKTNGRLLNTAHRELSSDGNMLKQTMVSIDERGAKTTTERAFIRYSKSRGLVGAWNDVNALNRQPQVLVTSLRGSIFHLGFPSEKQYTDTKLDGTDAPTHSELGGSVASLSVKPESSQQLLTTQKLNGTVVKLGVLILSSDGRSITEETWKPGAPMVKSRIVYDKM